MSETTWWLDHEFTVHEPSDDWPAASGLYIFAGRDPIFSTWNPLYVGRAKAFARRLPNHERWQEAEMLGGTHIHLRVERLGASLIALEKELIEAYQPPLNVLHR